MASFEKRKGGWRVKVRRKGAAPISATFRVKADGQAWAASMESDIASGRRGNIPNKTVAELVERYIREVTPTKRGARAEEFRLRRMIGLGADRDGIPRKPDALALVTLPDLGPEHFSTWRDRRLKQVSAASVLREWATLGHICNVAVKEWQWLQRNPLTGVKKPPPAKSRSRRISDAEIEALLLATGYQKVESPETATFRVGAALLFAIETGMRAGEICGLGWDDIRGRLAHLPKTKNGHPRDVPLSQEAQRIIDQLEKVKVTGEPIFRLSPGILDALFRKAKARALIEGLHFHDTRREALTRMAAKVDVMTLAKISGHRDLRILQNTYYAPNMEDVAPLLD